MPSKLPKLVILRSAVVLTAGYRTILLSTYWPVVIAMVGASAAHFFGADWARIAFLLIAGAELCPWATGWHRFIVSGVEPAHAFDRRDWHYVLTVVGFLAGAIALHFALIVGTVALGRAARVSIPVDVIGPIAFIFSFWILTPLLFSLPAKALGQQMSFDKAAQLLEGSRTSFLTVVSLPPIALLVARIFMGSSAIAQVVLDFASLLLFPVEITLLSVYYVFLTTGRLPSLEPEAAP